MQVREFRMEDYGAVADLWRRAGLIISKSDSPDGLARTLERGLGLFLVGEDDGRIVAVVMGTYDGRRGWVNHLAVDPAHQGQSLGRHLMEELVRRYEELGCDKVNLLIEPHNVAVQGFYERLGFQRRELIMMEKWLR